MILQQLQPGDKFRVHGTGQLGTLIMVNLCRARVRTNPPKQEGFTARDKPRSELTDWAPSVEVDLIGTSSSAMLEDAGII